LAIYSNKTSKLNYRKKRLGMASALISVFSILLLIVSFDLLEIFTISILGTFGLLFYPLCIFFIVLGILLLINKPIKSSKLILILSILWVCFFVLILQMLTSANIESGFKTYLITTFKYNITAGGVIFGVLLYPLYFLTHQVATYILLAIALVIVTAFLIDRIRIELKSRSILTISDTNISENNISDEINEELEDEIPLEGIPNNKKSELIDDNIFIPDEEEDDKELAKSKLGISSARTIKDLDDIAEASKLQSETIQVNESMSSVSKPTSKPEIIVHEDTFDINNNQYIVNADPKPKEKEKNKDDERREAALKYLEISKGKFPVQNMQKGLDNISSSQFQNTSSNVVNNNESILHTQTIENKNRIANLTNLSNAISSIERKQVAQNTHQVDIYDDNLTKKNFESGQYQSGQQITLPTQSKMPSTARNVYSGETNDNIVEAKGPRTVQVTMEPINVSKPQKTYNAPPKVYNRPPTDLLVKYSSQIDASQDQLKDNANKIVKTLEDFKIGTKVVNATKGPTFTRYELQMEPGYSVNSVMPRINDLSMALESKCRIQAPIPNKNAFGIEVPNKKRMTVGLRDIIESSKFQNSPSPLTIALGKDITNDCKIASIDKMVHTLVAGSTGSGKSVCLHTILISLLYKAGPEDLKLLLVDPKMVEFPMYNNLPHMLIPNAITDCDKAIMALEWLVDEMERRYQRLNSVCARTIESYNSTPEVKSGKLPKMFYIVMVFDEVGDYMVIAKKEIEDKVKRLAAKSRAAGIHLILTTQRPTVDVITGTIKTNLPSRIAFAVNSYNDSKTILESSGAENLLGMGDMLFLPKGSNDMERIQCAFVDDPELRAVINYIKENNEAEFDETIEDQMFNKKEGFDPGNTAEETLDPMLKECLKFFFKTKKPSTSSLQGYFAMGYPRANKIILQMEKHSFISPPDHKGRRNIYISEQEFEERFGESVDL